MHTYKDVIMDTKSVWILYPSDQDDSYVFYPDPREGKLGGIGAIGLIPGEDEILYSILHDILK